MSANEEITIGVVATLVGPYEMLGREGVVGVQLAVDEFNGTVAGKPIRLIVRESNAIPDSAVDAVRSLLDSDRVDFVIGPLSGNEGLAVRDYARTRPEYAFLNGCSAAQDLTLRDAAPNFFNFATHAVQNMAGLGRYVYEKLGYRRMVTLGEDYSYPHSLIGGFMIDFCRVGGTIAERFWVALGTRDYGDFFASLPADIDAIFMGVTGNDAIEFFHRYTEAGLKIPLVGGSSTVDPVVLNASRPLPDILVGMPSASPVTEDNRNPRWESLMRSYRQKVRTGSTSPSVPGYGYYLNTRAALLALEKIGGTFSDRQDNFKQALATLAFDSPTGPIRLDHHRQVIADIFINVLDRRADGSFYNRLIQTTPNVNSTLGIPEADYLALGSLTRDTDIAGWVERFRIGSQ
ncbi:MAG: ABC transporter substrate-binding protein [Chloroflexota bacterium]|nr:ABC transporter substrate-binding protein [Chloroflexota bacterium]